MFQVGDRIHAAIVQRVAAADPAQAQPAAFDGAVGFQSLQKITRTGRIKTTMGSEQRAEIAFIAENEKGEEFDHGADCSV